MKKISIHALLGRATVCYTVEVIYSKHFNPRSPGESDILQCPFLRLFLLFQSTLSWGERRYRWWDKIALQTFQSTLSWGERLELHCPLNAHTLISIHALLGRATQEVVEKVNISSISIHALLGRATFSLLIGL